jgi:hypothetical protein
LGEKNILSGSDRPQPQLIMSIDVTAKVRHGSLQQRTGILHLSGLPTRDRDVRHQSERLRVIGPNEFS